MKDSCCAGLTLSVVAQTQHSAVPRPMDPKQVSGTAEMKLCRPGVQPVGEWQFHHVDTGCEHRARLFCGGRRQLAIQSQVEQQGVDVRLAEKTQVTALRVPVHELAHGGSSSLTFPRHAGNRGMAALATEMCGSMPLPERVTASAGTASVSFNPLAVR